MLGSPFWTSLKRSSSFLKSDSARAGRECQQGKLCLEPLEDRTLLSTAVVGVSTTTPPNSVLGAGQTVNINVNFSQAVNVNTNISTPLLLINAIDQSSTAAASYSSGSGTSTLVFTYHVQSGDTTNGHALDYSSTSALYGTITNVSNGASANTTLPPPGGANDNLFLARVFIGSAPPSPPPAPSPPPGSPPSQLEQLLRQFLSMEQSMLNELSQAAQLVLPDLANYQTEIQQLFGPIVTELPGVSNVLNTGAIENVLLDPQAVQVVDQLLSTLESVAQDAFPGADVFAIPNVNAVTAFMNASSNNPLHSIPSS
jgi:hypothetical protein